MPEWLRLFFEEAADDGAGGTAPASAEPPAGDSGGDPGDVTPPASGEKPKLGWRAAVTPEYQEHELIRDLKGPNDLVKAYLDLHGKAANAIVKPGEGSTDEEIAAYRTAMGIPESAEGYELPEVEVPGFEGMNEWFAEKALARNIPKEAAEGLFSEYAEMVKTATERAAQQTQERTMTALTEKYGDQAKAKLSAAGRAAARFGGQAYLDFVDKTGLGNAIETVEAWLAVANAISEDSYAPGGANGQPQRRPGVFVFKNTPGMDKP